LRPPDSVRPLHQDRDLLGMLRDLGDRDSTELAEWPPAARGAFVAEIEPLQRIVELLLSFENALRRTIPPGL
jgi:hypothetical protein